MAPELPREVRSGRRHPEGRRRRIEHHHQSPGHARGPDLGNGAHSPAGGRRQHHHLHLPGRSRRLAVPRAARARGPARRGRGVGRQRRSTGPRHQPTPPPGGEAARAVPADRRGAQSRRHQRHADTRDDAAGPDSAAAAGERSGSPVGIQRVPRMGRGITLVPPHRHRTLSGVAEVAPARRPRRRPDRRHPRRHDRARP